MAIRLWALIFSRDKPASKIHVHARGSVSVLPLRGVSTESRTSAYIWFARLSVLEIRFFSQSRLPSSYVSQTSSFIISNLRRSRSLISKQSWNWKKTLAAPFISSIDSLRNDDGYGNENVTKKIISYFEESRIVSRHSASKVNNNYLKIKLSWTD